MEDKELLKKQKEEAIGRIEVLTKKYNLNPNIKKYFEEGKVYYSYLTAGGMMGSIDTINYDNRYATFVKEFEKNGSLVYHCIEYGDSLALLYVGIDTEDWPNQRLYKDYIPAYAHNFATPELSEIGDVIVSSFGESGALIRIG